MHRCWPINHIPKPDFHGKDSFDYVVSDGNGGTATGTVTIEINSVNDEPTAADDDFFVYFGSTNVVNVLANDSFEPDSDETLNISRVFDVSDNATAKIVDGKVEYTPDPEFIGFGSFRYEVSDNNGGSAIATATIDVHSWQNLAEPLDVNNDKLIIPLDALFVINLLNEKGTHRLSPPPLSLPFVDVDNNGLLSPVDALLIINHINRPEGEGELPVVLPPQELHASLAKQPQLQHSIASQAFDEPSSWYLDHNTNYSIPPSDVEDRDDEELLQDSAINFVLEDMEIEFEPFD